MEKLARSRVLVLGLGGVGGAAAEMLARLGVGRLTLADGDVFSPSNLNRQLGALSSTLGRNKAEVWRERCLAINPDGDFRAEKFSYHARIELFPGAREGIGRYFAASAPAIAAALRNAKPEPDLFELDLPDKTV